MERPVTHKLDERKRAAAFGFNPNHDIHLLKEVMQHAPFAAPHGKTREAWEEVANSLTPLLARKINHAAVKQQFDHLVKTFHNEEMESLRASGTEEEYDERERLLTDIVDLVCISVFHPFRCF